MGMGALAQVAKNPKHFQQLQEKSRELHRFGGAESEDEGARIVFALESANEMEQFELFKQLRSSGLVQQTDVMGRAARTLQASMGKEETGDIRAIVSKSFGASAYSPATAEALLEASSRSGGSARALKLSDEEVLASTAILATATGSAERGGTNIASLLRTLDEKREAVKGMTKSGELPRTLEEFLLAVKSSDMEGEKLKKFFGREEALEAYRALLLNMQTYKKALGDIHRSQRIDEVGQRLKYHEADPSLMAAKSRAQAQAKAEQSWRDAGTLRNLSESYILDTATRMREEGWPELVTWAKDKLLRFRRMTTLPSGPGAETNFLRSEAYGTGGSIRQLDEAGNLQVINETANQYLQAAEKLNKAADGLHRAVERMNNPNPATSHRDHR